MGSFAIKEIENTDQRNQFYREIFDDIAVFDYMLSAGMFYHEEVNVGVEQELCLIDDMGMPKNAALGLLHKLPEPQFTNELALFNLEINLDPQPIREAGLFKVRDQLYHTVNKARKAGKSMKTDIFLTGILPTITLANLTFRSMTPIERYKVLSRELLKLRGEKFEIYLQGVDDLNLKLDSILFEACNTSMQLHFQVHPDNFVKYYNWAQLISGPMLAISTNSPLLFGKELWAENRIALFKQSLDTRIHYNHYREKIPRVYFGGDWLQKSPSELWKQAIARFPLIFRGEGFPNSKLQLANGQTPELRSAKLHNGSTYTWNRLCYGIQDEKPHLRIECRYLPAGPSLRDEMANLTLWYGLMLAVEDQENNFWNSMDFAAIKSNFYNAARYGILSEFELFQQKPTVQSVFEEYFLPMAVAGLRKAGVEETIIEEYIPVIEQRIQKKQTGSAWLVENYRRLVKKFKPSLVSKILVKESLTYQLEDIPVSSWEPVTSDSLQHFFYHGFKKLTAKDVMSSRIQSIRENATVIFAQNIMTWQGINHLIVENEKDMFIGVLDWNDIKDLTDTDDNVDRYISKEFRKVSPNTSLEKIQHMIENQGVNAVVVMVKNKTAGIITRCDL